MGSRDFQHALSEGDAALRVFTCPDFPRAPSKGHSIHTTFDRSCVATPPYAGWTIGDHVDPDGSNIHSTYLYLGGIGNWSNETDGSRLWHGWYAYDADTYASYDDPSTASAPSSPWTTAGAPARWPC